jgi:hypothetical protein
MRLRFQVNGQDQGVKGQNHRRAVSMKRQYPLSSAACGYAIVPRIDADSRRLSREDDAFQALPVSIERTICVHPR